MSREEFYKKNKSYCNMAFNEIYTDSSGNYKLCCHANNHKPFKKYNSSHTPPFKFFFSTEMEEVRNKMMSGEKIKACEPCYKLEAATGESYRNTKYSKKYDFNNDDRNLGLKLRINGSYCNLGCYMCHPHNSSTRRKEMKSVFGNWDNFEFSKKTERAIKHKDWNDNIEDVLNNIESILHMHLTGGEPLQLPKHWQMLDMIPDDHAKYITLTYDTNLTELTYKNKSIFDYVNKFKQIRLGVSCDHFKEKEEWIRYPIDIKKFESNLREAKSIISSINCTVSLLNIFDLLEIKKYYEENFDIKVMFPSLVQHPHFLSIRNLDQKDKDMLLKKYEKIDDNPFATTIIKNELLLPATHKLDVMRNYCDSLSKRRNFNWRAIWNEF